MIRKKIAQLLKPILFSIEHKKRSKKNLNNPNQVYRETGVILKFRELEKVLRGYEYPQNDFNKTMSLILTDLEEFILISKRFLQNRKALKQITYEDHIFRELNPDAKSYPCHPNETEISLAIKLDTKSLFIFCIILLNKILLQLKLYFPDSDSKNYKSIYYFYNYLATNKHKEEIVEKYKNQFLADVKWFRCVLSVFRNKFLQHISRGYQTGATYGWESKDYSLTFYGWEYGDKTKKRANNLFSKLEKHGFSFPDRTRERSNMQFVFDNLEKVPHKYIDEAVNLIEIIGVQSPQPVDLINRVEKYIEDNFIFLKENINKSELEKYKK